MKTLVSAFFAALLLCGGSGCGRLCCRPWFPFLHHACTHEMGCQGVGLFNWSRCCDTCDQCGHWDGEDIIAETGDAYQPRYAGTPTHATRRHQAARVKPSSYRVTSHKEQPIADDTVIVDSTEDESGVDQVIEETEEPDETAPKPTTARRVRSSRPRSR